MGRYLSFDGNHFNFPLRADFRRRVEYFSDFVLGGTRDKAIYGLVRITPELTVQYDVDGLAFLRYVLGTVSADGVTVSVATTLPSADYKVTVDDDHLSVLEAKVNTWELTIEEGNPVRAEFTVIGKAYGSDVAETYSPPFCDIPVRPSECTLCVDGSPNTLWNRISVRVNNNLEPLFKGSTLPQDIRERGLEVELTVRAPEFGEFMSEGSIDITIGDKGTIVLPNVKFTEVPARVEGFDLPESELSFRAYPYCTEADAIQVILADTETW